MTLVRTLARLRILSARRPWLVWLGTALASFALVAVVHRPVADAAHTRATWGTTHEVLVAAHHVLAGTPIDDADLVVRALPVGLLPDHALAQPPSGAVVVRALERGEVVVEADLGTGDPRFALVPPGHVVMALPRPDAMVPARPGDRVSVSPPTGVAVEGVVVELTPATLLVAVAPADIPELAAVLSSSDPFAVVLRSGAATVDSP